VGVGVGRWLLEGGTTVVVTFLVVVTVVVASRVTVEVAVPDFNMLLQKSRASEVWPWNASSPQSPTTHHVSIIGLKSLLLPPGEMTIERTIRITILAFHKSSSICTCSKDCCENHGQLHLVDDVDMVWECADTDLELDSIRSKGNTLLIKLTKAFYPCMSHSLKGGSNVHSLVDFIYK
jgi:hypothetical protein